MTYTCADSKSVPFAGAGFHFYITAKSGKSLRATRRLCLLKRLRRTPVKRLLAIVLMLTVLPASAEWRLLIVTDAEDTYYVDPATKTRGKKPRVTTLLNGRSRETRMSNKVVWEADCQKRRVRALSRIGYEKRYFQGKVLFHDKHPGDPVFPLPNSPTEKLFVYLCGFKP